MIRPTITFTDGVKTIGDQEWPDDQDWLAQKFADAVTREHVGSACEMEWHCEAHGWEPFHQCADCLSPICAVQAVRSAGTHDVHLCRACIKARREESGSHQESHG